MVNIVDEVMRIAAVNGAADIMGGSEDLIHDSGDLSGHRSGTHDAGSIVDIIHGVVTVVLDVLHLLPVPGGFLQQRAQSKTWSVCSGS